MNNDKLKKKIIKFICVAVVFLCIIVFDFIKNFNDNESVSNESINTQSSIVEISDSEVNDSEEINDNDKDIILNNDNEALDESSEVNSDDNCDEKDKNTKEYTFRTQSQFTGHFEKHGEEVGCKSEEEYLAAANAVINNPKALHKLEAEDNDHIYYIEDTNEIVFLSQDGYIRTYFICSGKAYYDRQ